MAADDDLVTSLWALVGEESSDPASHRRAHDVAAFDTERILELAQEVNEEWKRIDSIDGVARGEAEKIRREDSEHGCQHAKGCEAIVGPAFDARQVKKNERVAFSGVDVARIAVLQLHRLMDRRSSR